MNFYFVVLVVITLVGHRCKPQASVIIIIIIIIIIVNTSQSCRTMDWQWTWGQCCMLCLFTAVENKKSGRKPTVEQYRLEPLLQSTNHPAWELVCYHFLYRKKIKLSNYMLNDRNSSGILIGWPLSRYCGRQFSENTWHSCLFYAVLISCLHF